ncbi:MAG: CehA/McbA family metallohydrolase [Capsulimonadales bacterium]|nr:CehA/McbA family metallohydrolase [Capsulimonadales bacterium]
MKTAFVVGGALLLLGTVAGSIVSGRGIPRFLSPLNGPPTEKVLIVEGRREPSEAVVGRRAMKYLPFDVPEGVTRLVIRKEFDHGADPDRRNTVDMGLFDPRGGDATKGEPNAAGFRGWQGGVPNDLVVAATPDACSPHAIPGYLPAGRWHIAQYFLKSSPSGLGYRYTITLSFDGATPKKGNAPIPAYEPGILRPDAGWYVGNLHSHTVHSDGGRTLEDLVTRSESKGFDFLAVTDHNSPATHYHFAAVGRAHPNHLLLMGNEFTSPGGHANILNQKPGHFFDFRFDPGEGRLPAVIEEAHRQQALFMVNHPFAPCTSCPWIYPTSEWDRADAIEVWNGPWTPDDRRAVDLWDRLLKQGRRLHAFGGTDYHRGEDAMIPAVRVFAANLSRKAVMEGLTKGRVTLSETPQGPTLSLTDARGTALPGATLRTRQGETIPIEVRVTGGMGKRLRLIRSDGETTRQVTTDEERISLTIPAPAGSGYVRAELTGEDGRMLALTNPLYLVSGR